MADRSISIYLDEALLADLDAQGANRTALVRKVISQRPSPLYRDLVHPYPGT